MKIVYKTILKENDRYKKHEELKTLSPLCCDRMKKVWDDAICFGYAEFGGDNKPEVQILAKSWAYDCVDVETHPIDFCPFCGVKVVTEEGERVRLVQKVEKFLREDTRLTYVEEKIDKED